ncbi:MarC family protein [Alkalihalobacillus sp. NPDC078783]
MLSFTLQAIVSIFAIMNPIGNVPIFIAMTQTNTVRETRAIAFKAIITAFVILTAFLIVGPLLFRAFGITVDALRIAGGIIIFGIGYNLVSAKSKHSHTLHEDEHQEGIEKDDISITPLGIPLIAGPGTIATVMSLTSSHSDRISHTIGVFIAFTIILLVTYLIFYYSHWIHSKLNATELSIVTRLMGLILTVMAVEMIVSGLKEVLTM